MKLDDKEVITLMNSYQKEIDDKVNELVEQINKDKEE